MKSSFDAVLKRKVKRPDRESSGEVELSLPIAVHPNIQSGKIIISYPGFMGDIDGYNGKYQKLANFMQEKIGAVIRSANNYYESFDYEESVQEDLRMVIRYALLNAKNFCGQKEPAIYLIGFSAGASAIAAVAYEFPAVQRILLVSPSEDAGDKSIRKGLAEFAGQVYIVAGANDDIVGPEAAPRMSAMVKKASVHKLVIVPDCDHQFRGVSNGMIMSKAPLWAFAGDADFPSSHGGIRLY